MQIDFLPKRQETLRTRTDINLQRIVPDWSVHKYNILRDKMLKVCFMHSGILLLLWDLPRLCIHLSDYLIVTECSVEYHSMLPLFLCRYLLPLPGRTADGRKVVMQRLGVYHPWTV